MAVSGLFGAFLITTAAPTAAQAQAGPDGGVIRVMLNSDLRSTDPGVNRDLNSDTITMHMVEGLVAYKEDLTVGPMLAESVVSSDDGRTYTFTLRENVTFHNGAMLTSDDVLFAFKRYLDPATQWRCLSAFDGTSSMKIVDIRAPDDMTFVIEIEEPSALFLGLLARTDCGGAGIYHRDSVGPDGEWRQLIGTGPYKWGKRRRGQSVELVRFDGYASRGGERDGLTGGKTPIAQAVRFVIIPDGSAAKAALYSGAIDVRPDFGARNVAEARARNDVMVGKHPTMELNGVLMRTEHPLLSDIRIRRALSKSIDGAALVEALTYGLVDPVYSPVPLSSPFSGPLQRATMPYDVEGAKTLLSEAGYAGEPIELLTTQRFTSYFNAAVFIQAMAKEAGIELEIEVLEWATLVDRYVSGDYAAMVFGFSARLDAALNFEMISGDKNADPRKVWDNPAARELIDAAMVESRPAQRQALFDRLHQKFIEDLPMIPLWNSVDIAAWRTNVSGYQTWPASIPRLWNVSLD